MPAATFTAWAWCSTKCCAASGRSEGAFKACSCSSLKTSRGHRHGSIPAFREIWRKSASNACTRSPGDRYQNAAELSADLARFLRGDAVLARPISRLARGWRMVRKRPRTTMSVVAASLAAMSLLVGVLFVMHRAKLKRIDELADFYASKGTDLLDAGDRNQAIPYFGSRVGAVVRPSSRSGSAGSSVQRPRAGCPTGRNLGHPRIPWQPLRVVRASRSWPKRARSLHA